MKTIILKGAVLKNMAQYPDGVYDQDIKVDVTEASDGYHTFDELYEHRITIFIAMCRLAETMQRMFNMPENIPKRFDIWRSKVNGDGSVWNGWFVMGINKNAGEQITYHLPMNKWDETDFAQTLEKGPDFDGHTSSDILERIKLL